MLILIMLTYLPYSKIYLCGSSEIPNLELKLVFTFQNKPNILMVGMKKSVPSGIFTYFTFPVNTYSHTVFPADMKNVKQGKKKSV